MLLTPDMKLIHALLQKNNIKDFYVARTAGVHEDILFDEARKIWTLIEEQAVSGRLPSLGEIELATGISIEELSPTPLDPLLCAKYIVKRGLSNDLHKHLGEITAGDAINEDPFKVRDELIDLPHKITWSFGDPCSVNSRQGADALMEAYERAEARGSALLGLESPWSIINDCSLGLQEGELTVLFAKRKIGKSWLTIVWAMHIWKTLKPGQRLIFVTMEMTSLQVLRRMACIALRFSWNDFRAGRLTSGERQRLVEWVRERREASPEEADIIIIDSNTVRTVKDLSAVVGEHRPVGVIVDSFYILGRASGASIYERVLTNVQEMKLDIALRYNVPVLASTQLKGTTDKDVLMADSDDAMGAKAIGDYADATFGLFANTELKNGNKRLLRGMEAREFLPRGIKMWFDLDRMVFDQIEEAKVVEKEEKEKKDKKKGKKGKRPPSPTEAAPDDETEDGRLYA